MKKKKSLLRRLSPFKKKETIKSLEGKLENLYNKQRLQEHRFYEETRGRHDFIRGGAPNNRNHWQAKPLREQARHLYENDPIARRVVDSIVCNMVGRGVMPIPRHENPEIAAAIEGFLNTWNNTTDVDFDGDHNLSGIQSLVIKTLVRDGAVFVKRIVRRRKISLQVLEPDYLDVIKNGINHDNDNEIINGIEYHKVTRQVAAYWLYEFHPEDNYSQGHNTGTRFVTENPRSYYTTGAGGRSLRTPVIDVCHIKRIDRPGQQDGISWLAPALTKLWDLREYEESKLKQQKLQACFTAFVQDNFELGEEERADILGLARKDSETMTGRTISAGHIEELPPGKTITFPQGTQTGNENFVERCLRSIAGALGVSYEIFNDYSQVSYSSGRMGFMEMDRHLKHVMRTLIEPQLLSRVSKWILIHLEMNDIIPPDHGAVIDWTPPAREMIDPNAESKALASMVSSNLISLREAHAMMGKDFERSVVDIAKTNNRLRELGLSPLLSFAGSPASEDALPNAMINQEEVSNEENNEEENDSQSESRPPE